MLNCTIVVIVPQRNIPLQWQFYSLKLLPGDTSDHTFMCTPKETPEDWTVRPETPRTSVHLSAVPVMYLPLLTAGLQLQIQKADSSQ